MNNTKEPTRLRDLKEGVRDLIMLNPRIIEIEQNHNPRDYTLPENREHLDALKDSIREHGVRQPLWVRWETTTKKAILVDGECRLRVVLELIEEGCEIASVPTFQVSGADAGDRLILALTANTGKPLSKLEDGAAYLRLRNYGWSDEKIAQKVARKERYIREAIELAEAPAEVREILKTGTVTDAAALSAARSGDVEGLKNGNGKRAREKKSASLPLELIARIVGALEDKELIKLIEEKVYGK